MDESLQELENELKSLQPRRAPARWLQQVNRELAAEVPAAKPARYASATNLGSWKWLGWRSSALAAALALVAITGLVRYQPARPPGAVAAMPEAPAMEQASTTPAYQPVAASNVLYDLRDEGEVKFAGETTARQVRARYVDTYTWKNPRTNASIKWTVPRDEVRVLPASFNPN